MTQKSHLSESTRPGFFNLSTTMRNEELRLQKLGPPNNGAHRVTVWQGLSAASLLQLVLLVPPAWRLARATIEGKARATLGAKLGAKLTW